MKKKKIAVVQFYFYPDISAVSQLLSDLLSDVSKEKNIEITVYCGRSSYYDKNSVERRLKKFGEIKIKRIMTLNLGRKSLLTRMIDYFFYYVSILVLFLLRNKWDLVISLTSPPIISFLVSIALQFKRTPFIYYIQDLYPELFYDISYIQDPWIIRKLQILNRITIRRADRIITIGKFMSNKLQHSYHIPSKKLVCIHNWAKGIVRKSIQNNGLFTILYSGNMGIAHDFKYLTLLIHRLKSEINIFYHFIGGGKGKKDLLAIFEKTGEKRIRIEGYTEIDMVSSNLSKANVLLIAQKEQTVGDILPCKIYSYLAAGRPVLFLGPKESDIGEMIIKNDIGVVFESEHDLNYVYDYLMLLKNNPGIADAIGERAKKIHDTKYGFENSARSFKKLVEEMLYDK